MRSSRAVLPMLPGQDESWWISMSARRPGRPRLNPAVQSQFHRPTGFRDLVQTALGRGGGVRRSGDRIHAADDLQSQRHR